MGSEAELRQSLGVVEAEHPRRGSLTSRTYPLRTSYQPHTPSRPLAHPHPPARWQAEKAKEEAAERQREMEARREAARIARQR